MLALPLRACVHTCMCFSVHVCTHPHEHTHTGAQIYHYVKICVEELCAQHNSSLKRKKHTCIKTETCNGGCFIEDSGRRGELLLISLNTGLFFKFNIFIFIFWGCV